MGLERLKRGPNARGAAQKFRKEATAENFSASSLPNATQRLCAKPDGELCSGAL